jgi:hypothetical protein
MVVLLGAPEEEYQVIAGALSSKTSLAVRESHRTVLDLFENLMFHALGQQLGHYRLECNRAVAARV